MAEETSIDKDTASVGFIGVHPLRACNPDDGDTTRRVLLDLAVGLRDTCDDMTDLLPPTPHSMSSDQLIASRLVASARAAADALLVVLQ